MEHWSLRELLGSAERPEEQRVVEAWFGGDQQAVLRLTAPWTEGAAPEDPEGLSAWLRMKAVGAAARTEHTLDALRVPAELGRGTRARGLLEAFRAWSTFQRWDLREAIAAAGAAARPDAGLTESDRACLIRDLGEFRYRSGDRSGAKEAWASAEGLFQRLDMPVEELGCRLRLARIWLDSGWLDRVRPVAEEAARQARDRVAVDEEVQALLLLWELGQRRTLDRAHEVALRNERSDLLLQVLLARAKGAVVDRESDAVARCEEAHGLADALGSLEARCLSLGLLAVCRAREGSESLAAGLLAEAEGPLKGNGIADSLAQVRLCAALSWLALDRPDRAREEAEWTAFYASEVGDLMLRDQAEAVHASIGQTEDQDQDRVRRLVELASRVDLEDDPKNALDAVAVAALDVLGADRAFVLLREDGELRVASSALAPEQPEGQPSMSVVQRCVAREGREVLAADLDERGELRGSDSMVALSLRSVLCVPIVLRTGVVGALYVDSRRSSEKVLSRAAWMLRALAGQAAAVVRTARRLEDSELRARRGAEFAHDVKGALNVVNLLAEELSELKLSEGAEAVADLEAVTGRLISMVHRFLADEQPSQAPLRLDRLVEQVLGPMSREAHRARRSLELDLCPAQVVGSREQLGRVLTNLVGNALKYATSRIHVSLAVEGDQAVLRVRDDGPGLPQDHASLFEAGVQAPGALPGQGLGLAIVQRMVWDHRGTVSARSLEPGAVFEVRLPLS